MATLMRLTQESTNSSQIDDFCLTVADKLYFYSGLEKKLTELDVPKYVTTAQEEPNKYIQSSEKCSDSLLAGAVSLDGRYLAVCDARKRLFVWTRGDHRRLTLHNNRSLVRRCTSVRFTANAQEILACDKSGDVYQFSTHDVVKDGSDFTKDRSDVTREGLLIKGHLSMLLDMFITSDDRYVVTCDRDEKIHVSNYPNAYNIQTFCLGHTEFVSCLADLHHEHMFASASGDGTIRLWNYVTGQLLQTITCSDHVTSSSQSQIANDVTSQDENDYLKDPLVVREMTFDREHGCLAIILHTKSLVQLYHLSNSRLSIGPCLACEGEALAVSFTSTGSVLVVQNAQRPLTHFIRLEDGTFEGAFEEDFDFVKIINAKVDLLEGLDDKKSLLPTLYKAKVDNMKHYLAKKRERLRMGQKKKLKTW